MAEWNEAEQMIIARLNRVEEDLRCTKKGLSRVRQKDIPEIQVNVAKLAVKLSIWSAFIGAAVSAGTSIALRFLTFG